MKIAITGAGGMLGRALQKQLADQYQLLALTEAQLDITCLEAVRRTFTLERPDVVINSAAMTNVDGCETDQDKAFLINAGGVRNLAIVCNELDCALVQLSTDYVFNGQGVAPYGEYDQAGPVSIYGKSKLAGEELVKALHDKFYIVRTAWLFGEGGPNFVQTILRLAKEQEYLSIVDDQVGTPTYTQDLAQAIGQLIATGYYGVYHLTNGEPCSWYEFAREILRQTGKGDLEVRPIKSDQLKRPAPRPSYSVLENRFWRLAGFAELRSHKEALREYLQNVDK